MARTTFGVAEDGYQTPQPVSYASGYDGQEVYGDQQTAFPQDPGNNPPRTAFAFNLGNHQRHQSEKVPAPKSSGKRPVLSSGGLGAKTFSSPWVKDQPRDIINRLNGYLSPGYQKLLAYGTRSTSLEGLSPWQSWEIKRIKRLLS